MRPSTFHSWLDWFDPFYCKQVKDLMARELIPGDVVLIKSGDRIPADCRLVQAADLFVDESRYKTV